MKKTRWVLLACGCSAVLSAVLLTGCLLPGHHGGHHGLPGPPRLPGHHGSHQANPAKDYGANTRESFDGNQSPQLAQNRNAPTSQ